MMSRYRKGVSVTTVVVNAALCQPTRLCESAASSAPLTLASAAGHAADDPSGSMPPTTRAATSSSATHYDKHAIVHRTAVILNAVIAWTRLLSDTP